MNLLQISLCRFPGLLFAYLIFVSFSVSAQNDTLADLVSARGPEKLTRLEHWYYETLFYNKPQRKIQLLNRLEQIAIHKNDKITQASVVFYRGLYVYAKDKGQHERGIATMLKAIEMAENNEQQLQVAYFKHAMGYYYFTEKKDYVQALENMLKAHYEFSQTGYHNVRDAAGMLDRLSFVYYHLSNFNESIRNLKLSLKYPMAKPRRRIGILNTIGQGYRELFEQDSAMKYFRLSRHYAIRAKDTAWIGITSGNIGRYYLGRKAFVQAEPYMQEFHRCGLVVKDSSLVIEALTGLADIARSSGKTKQSLQLLGQAETLLDKSFRKVNIPFQNYVRKQYLYSVYASAWEDYGDAGRSLAYLKQANIISDSIARRAKLSKNIAIQQWFEAEQTNNRLELLKKEKQAVEAKQSFMIAIGLLCVIIFALLYNRQIRKRKIQNQQAILLKLENEKAQSDLQNAVQQLDEYVSHLREKTDLLDTAQVEMDSLREQYQIPVEDEQVVLHKLSHATILTEDDWRKFRVLFEKVHTGFFQKLKSVYPDLTPAETRLCSLIKLGLNSHEMAAMMGISAMSIKKSRQRLRKKINLEESCKLEKLFSDF